MIFPWQREQWQLLQDALLSGRLPHALLFAGIAGTGKANFAEAFTQLLLCTDRSHQDSKQKDACHACRLIAGRAHPNVVSLAPEKEGAAIKVDQIREVNEFIQQSSLQGEYRIVIINPADAMNASAANALLKTLEEPAGGTVIVLISAQSERLPATIRSRCQRILFPAPDHAQALQWLQQQLDDKQANHELLLNLANGAPLAAQALATTDILALRKELFDTLSTLKQQGDPLKAAAALQDIEPLQLIDFMLSWMKDLLQIALTESNLIINTDYAKDLTQLALQQDLRQQAKYVEFLLQLRSQICAGINFNKQLLFENVLIRWAQACT